MCELITDKTSDAFLMGFQRFACLHGHQNVCWSDHGTNFVGAQGYLKGITQNWDIPGVKSVLSDKFSCKLRWELNTPYASHQKGVVETLIQSSDKHLTPLARTKPTPRNNGEQFCQKSPTWSTDNRCTPVPTISGRPHRSFQTTYF